MRPTRTRTRTIPAAEGVVRVADGEAEVLGEGRAVRRVREVVVERRLELEAEALVVLVRAARVEQALEEVVARHAHAGHAHRAQRARVRVRPVRALLRAARLVLVLLLADRRHRRTARQFALFNYVYKYNAGTVYVHHSYKRMHCYHSANIFYKYNIWLYCTNNELLYQYTRACTALESTYEYAQYARASKRDGIMRLSGAGRE